MNPSNFEIVWNRASTIYKTLGAIDAARTEEPEP
jgi:hypothetical protein